MKYKLLVLAFFVILLQSIHCQIITDIKAIQSGDKIKINYNIKNQQNKSIETILKVSYDGGQTFFQPEQLIIGDGEVSNKVKEGNNEITWNVLDERSSFISDKVVFKIVCYPYEAIDNRDGIHYFASFYNGQVWFLQELTFQTSYGSWPTQYPLTRYYDWETSKNACPDGWHLPSKMEFDKLVTNAGGEGKKAFEAMDQFSESTNPLRFTLGAYGIRLPNGTINDNVGAYWSSTEDNVGKAVALYIEELPNETVQFKSFDKRNGLLIRCIMNENIFISSDSKLYTFVISKEKLDIQTIKPSLYVKSYVDQKIIEWEKKGEFEKSSDYTNRVNDQSKKSKMLQLANEAIKQMKVSFTKHIDWDNCILGSYDADNESFTIISPQLSSFFFKVPVTEAPSFKENWKNLQIVNIDYSPIGEKLELAKISMKNPTNGKIYYYDNKLPVSLDFDKTLFE
jgi:uncharacterized protein (TIGR02145 family)